MQLFNQQAMKIWAEVQRPMQSLAVNALKPLGKERPGLQQKGNDIIKIEDILSKQCVNWKIFFLLCVSYSGIIIKFAKVCFSFCSTVASYRQSLFNIIKFSP